MNINSRITGLEEVTGCPVEADIYTGTADRYITFTWEDERPASHGDNRAVADTAYLQISYFCPSDYDYFADKHTIRDYLESWGCKVSMRSWLEDDVIRQGSRIRRVLFEAIYTETRK